MKVIVVGCGRLGSDLAVRLFKQGHEVSVIDNVPAAFANLPGDFQGRVIEGEALSQDVLFRAGIERADALVAATNSDALNAVVGHIAKSMYDVPRVAARNYDPHCRPMLESFNLQVVSSTSWGAQRLEELIYHADVRTLYSAGNGEVEFYEITIPEDKDGVTVAEVEIPGEMIVISVTRAGRADLPKPTMVLHEGDILNISATNEGIEKLRSHLDQQKGA